MKVSVVIPAYNAAAFITRCLQSVFAQTLKPEEVIVVDDGSTDNTAALAAELGAKVISQPNGGIAAARNAGIRNACGDWIALLDADDLWAPTKLERQLACVRPENVLVYTGIRICDDNGVRAELPAIDPISARKVLRCYNPISPSTVLLKREAVLRIGGFREGILACEDWGMWVRLMPVGQFEAVVDPLTDYYVHPTSVSANPDAMILGTRQILDKTLVADLRGFDRWAWRRRILATQFCSAGLIARDNGLKSELTYLFRSLCIWPSPFYQPKRFATFAVSVRNKFRRLGQVF